MYKALLVILFSCFIYSAQAQNGRDTFRLYFDLNVAALNKNTEKKIDLLIYNDKIINGSNVMVIGYADFLGSEGYNKNLSMQRARNIKNYLVKYGISAEYIKMCVGEGKVERKEMTDKDGNPIDRRVDIVVDNNVERLRVVKSPSGATAGTIPKPKPKTDTARRSKTSVADLKELGSLKEGQTLLLKNVYFPLGSHFIKPESYETLEKLYKTMVDNPKLRISIEGHVCCINSDAADATDNDTNEPVLSYNRAKAIYEYLVKKGINGDRMQYIGFGKQHPVVAVERSEDDANLNRRVEVRVLSNQ